MMSSRRDYYYEIIWGIHSVILDRYKEHNISDEDYFHIYPWHTLTANMEFKRRETKDFRQNMFSLIKKICQIEILAPNNIDVVQMFINTEYFPDLREEAYVVLEKLTGLA